MRTYFVTGGAGFIGSNYIQYLMTKYSRDNIRVINFDKLTYAGNLKNLEQVSQYENYIFIKGDICDRNVVEQVFSDYDIDRVVHFLCGKSCGQKY